MVHTRTPSRRRDFLNGPEFQKLFDELWASSRPMKYRAWREYRDRYPRLVLLWNGDEYPDLTRAIARTVPPAVREGMRPAGIVRSHLDTSWCMATQTEAFLIYTMNGDAITLDLTDVPGKYAVSWLDSASGVLQKAASTVEGGSTVTLSPPVTASGRPWVAWLKK